MLLETEEARQIKNGAKLKHTFTSVLGGVGLYEKYGSNENFFIGVGEVSDDGVLSPKRLLHGI